jgi:rubrerythrin
VYYVFKGELNMAGFVKVYRELYEHPIVHKDNDYLSVWLYLLLNATHTEYKAEFKGQVITLKKGQLLCGRISISEKSMVEQSKVERILKRLISEQMIEQQTSSKNRLITILNWDKYQIVEQQNEQQVNNKRTTSEQQVNTNKNDKNVIMKEERLKIKDKDNTFNDFAIVEVVDEVETWFDFFWKEYPKKVVKKDAYTKFRKIVKTKEVFDDIMQDVHKRKNDKEFIKNNGQFVPFPTTYLNQERWKDESTQTKGMSFFDIE